MSSDEANTTPLRHYPFGLHELQWLAIVAGTTCAVTGAVAGFVALTELYKNPPQATLLVLGLCGILGGAGWWAVFVLVRIMGRAGLLGAAFQSHQRRHAASLVDPGRESR